MALEPSKLWKQEELTDLQREHYLLAKSFAREFTIEEFQEEYRKLYPERVSTSILPSDYAYNNDQLDRDKYPSFLERVDRGVYRFVDLVEPVTGSGRNPNWSRDELVLALDFYMAHRPNFPSKDSDEINQLSADISAVGKLLGLGGSDSFRNTNGVYMKLMNFRRFDPDYTDTGKVGLSRGGKGDEEVWNDFAGDIVRLGNAAAIIRSELNNPTPHSYVAEEEPDLAEAAEGRIVTRLHRTRERSRKLVLAKKTVFQKANGRLHCEACGFDFNEAYGDRGIGFMECHHTKPIHTLKEGEVTKLEDLVLLCANCHRMVHIKSPWLSVEELQGLLLSLKLAPP